MHVGHARFLRYTGALRATAQALSDEALAAEWKSVDAAKTASEPALREPYAALLREQRIAVLTRWRVGGARVIEAETGPAPPQKRGDPRSSEEPPDDRKARLGALILDVEEWLEGIEAEFGPTLAAVLQGGFETGRIRTGVLELAFELTPRAQAALAEGVAMIQGTVETTQKLLGGIIERGLEEGADVDAISDAISAAFSDWTETRAQTVARTEATRAFEAGQLDAYHKADMGGKRWLSQRDGDVRPEHDALDGEEVGLDEAFSNGLQYPSEPNCRCTTLPVPKRPAPKAQPVARPWREVRDEAIRTAYPALREEEGQVAALATLAERYNVSERTVRRALWE